MKSLILFAVVFTVVAHCAPTYSDNTMDPKKEYRYCDVPKRDASGAIYRSSAVTTAFRNLYACPSTGLHSGACPGWQINHDKSLACGGCDAVYNMSWHSTIVKTSAVIGIDRYELKINGGVVPGTENECSTPPLGGIGYPARHGTLNY